MAPAVHVPRRRALSPVARPALAIALGAAVLGACGSSGRDLAEVPAGETAPTRSTVAAPATVPAVDPSTEGLALIADGWTPGGELPAAASCDDAGTSPALRIQASAADGTELAVVVTDPDAADFVHWIVTGLAPASADLPAGAPPPGEESTNSSGTTGWFPLCPPPGDPHTYELQLLAFTSPPDTGGADDPAAVVAALESQATSRSLVTGTFQR